MSSSLSEYLPESISKWFIGGNTSLNESIPVGDTTDSSTEDEETESEPPRKKFNIGNSPTNKLLQYSDHFGNNDASIRNKSYDYVSMKRCLLEPGTSSEITTSLKFYDPQPVETNNSKPVSPGSTTANKSYVDNHTIDTSNASPISLGSTSKVSKDNDNSKKMIFRTKSDEKSDTVLTNSKSSHKSSFKPSLLCSPFYPGRTMYGGAAASSLYFNKPNVQQLKTATVNKNKTGTNSNISHTAQRIMDLIERGHSPLSKVQQELHFIKRNHANGSTSTQSVHFKTKLENNIARQIDASHSSTSDCAPFLKHNSICNLITKEAPKWKLKALKIKSIDYQGSENEIPLPPDSSFPLEISTNNLPQFSISSNRNSSKFETANTLETCAKNTKQSIEKYGPVKRKSSLRDSNYQIKRKAIIGTDDNSYAFSRPVILSDEQGRDRSSNSTAYLIDRSEVIPSGTNADVEMKDSICNIDRSSTSKNRGHPLSPDKWQCSTCRASNSPNNEKCGLCLNLKLQNVSSEKEESLSQKLTNTKHKIHTDKIGESIKVDVIRNSEEQNSIPVNKDWKCHVCWIKNKWETDKCGACKTNKPFALPDRNPSNQKSNSPPVSADWKCDVCWIKNKSTLSKCAACESSKPLVVIEHTSSQKKSDSSPVNSDWTCDVCWIKNKWESDNCAACQASKTVPKQVTSSDSSKDDRKSPKNSIANKSYSTIIQDQKEKWLCSCCLMRNDNSKICCVCCETPKPGAEENNKTTFDFTTKSTTTFKFGIDVAKIDSDLPKNNSFGEHNKPKESDNKFEAVETNNNVSKAPLFNFGIPSKNISDIVDNSKKNDVSKKPVFKFENITTNLEENLVDHSKDKNNENIKHLSDTSANKIDAKIKVNSFALTPNENATSTPIKGTPVISFGNPTFVSTPKEKVQVNTDAIVPTLSIEKNEQQTFKTLTVPSNVISATLTTSIPTSNAAPAAVTSANNATVMFGQFQPQSTPSMADSKAQETVAPVFTFGYKTQSETHKKYEPEFNFSFGTNNAKAFKPTFAPKSLSELQENNFCVPPKNVFGSSINQNDSVFGSLQTNEAPPTNVFENRNITGDLQKSAFSTISFGNNNMPVFPSSAQTPVTNIFGTPNQNSTSPVTPFFPSAVHNSLVSVPSFDNVQPSSQPNLRMFGMIPEGNAFGNTNMGPAFETPALNTAQAFTFGAPQPTRMFGFDQQPPAAGVYNFGATLGGTPPVQFNMGSFTTTPAASGTVQRKVRRAARRMTTHR